MNRIFDFLNSNSKGIMKVIGANSEEEYNYILRKIYNEVDETSSVIFKNGIPFPTNTQIINIIQENSRFMNLNCIEREEINLTNNENFNKILKVAIDNILANVLRDKPFKSDNVKANFFVKEIVWIYEIISKTNLVKFPSIIYYGQIEEDEIYLLEILSSIGFKILLFSSNVDINIRATENIIFDKRLPFVNYNIRVANGLDNLPEKNEIVSNENLIVVKSIAKQAKEEIENDFLQSGIFKPWKFRKGYVKSICIDSVIEDVTSYWIEDSRFRPNFKCEGDTIYTPNFFMKVNGVYKDKIKYKKLIELTKNTPLTLFKEDFNLVNKNLPTQKVYSLAFVLNETQTEIDIDTIKKHKEYKINKYNSDVQILLIKKLNEFYSAFKDEIELKDFLDLVYVVINLKEEFGRLIENFDFPYKIPKLVIYLEKREYLSKLNAMFTHYLSLLGLDIIIFSPMGAPCIEDYLFNKHLSITDLEEMIFDLSYSSLSELKEPKSNKKLFDFKKLFN